MRPPRRARGRGRAALGRRRLPTALGAQTARMGTRGLGALRLFGPAAGRAGPDRRLARAERAPRPPDRAARGRERAARHGRGHRPAHRRRRARLGILCRRGEPARRRGLLRTGPGSGRGRDHVRRAVAPQRPRVPRRATALRGGRRRRRLRELRRGRAALTPGHRRGRAPGGRVRDRHERADPARRRRHALRREDRRHVPPRARPVVPAARRRQRLGDPLGPGLRPASRRPHRRRRRAAAGRGRLLV